MSAFDVLSRQCRRRGWRLLLTGAGPARKSGMVLDGLEVRLAGELLARVPVDGRLDDLELYPALERAAVRVGMALVRQGLISA